MTTNPPNTRALRLYGPFALVALVAAFAITRGLVAAPGYADAYYYFNAAERLAAGHGLTDAYLWTYIGAPEQLAPGETVPSHTYWMPLTSLIAAFGMWVFGAPGDYVAAQWPFALLLAGAALTAFWLGGRLGGGARHRWVAGIITLTGGFFVRFWGATDSFTPYALVGALALICIGLGASNPDARTRRFIACWLLAGVFAGLGHLARADGLLLVIVGAAVILWPFGAGMPAQRRIIALGVLALGYLLVMTPWFLRNIDATGAPLPLGGTDAIWFTEYNDLFNYPPGADPATFFADGLGVLLSSRWEAFTNNAGTFIAVQGLIVMAPLMLVGLWVRRADPFVRGFWLYALGLHLAMTFVFPYPGYRGGLFHSAAALMPWWSALGVVGLDTVVDAVARRRRTWKPRTAKRIFSFGLVALALALSLNVAIGGRVEAETPPLYAELTRTLPDDARVMINSPAALYHYTGLSGVVLPNTEPDAIAEIAARYNVTHLLLEGITEFDGVVIALTAPVGLTRIPADPPDFLHPLPFDVPGVRLYAIHTNDS